MVISLSNEYHVYANKGIVSFLYDRPECKPKGSGEHRCDVILIEFSQRKLIWIIECKSEVGDREASTAIKQIEGCSKMIHNAGDWQIKKLVIGEEFPSQRAVRSLGLKGILHTELKSSRIDKGLESIVNAVKKIEGC